MSCLERSYNFVNKYKVCIVIFWPLLALCCAYWALDLINYAQFNFLPPNNSNSAIAYDKIQEYFPKYVFQDIEMILMKSNDVINTNNPQLRKIYQELNATIMNSEYGPNNNGMLESFTYYYEFIPVYDTPYGEYLKSHFINDDDTLMLSFLTANVDGVEQNELNDYIDKMSDICDEYSTDEYTFTLTGGLTMWKQAMQIIQDDMTSKDIIFMPFILIFMGYVIGSWKLVILPGSVLGMNVVISMTTFLPFAKYNIVLLNPLAPSIMMFLCMALSVDYSLFLLSRFAEERRKGLNVEDSVREMMRYSAHVVLLSGFVLIVCYSGVAVFPITGMDTVGYGAMIAIFYCIVVNVTFQSACILTFPKFFGNLQVLPLCCINYICCCCKERLLKNNDITSDNNEIEINPNDPNDVILNHGRISDHLTSAQIKIMNQNDDQKHINNCYFKLTQYTTKSPWKYIVPLLVYGLMTPCIITLFKYEYSMDFTMYFPQGTDSVKAYNDIIDNFATGFMSPIYVLTESNQNSIWNENYYNDVCNLGNSLITGYNLASTSMKSPVFVPYINVSDNNAINESRIACIHKQETIDGLEILVNNPTNFVNYIENINQTKYNITNIVNNITNTFPNATILQYYNDFLELFYTFVNEPSASIPNQTATLTQIIPPFNGYLGSSVKPANNLRDLVNNLNPISSNYYVHSALYWQIDSMDDTYNELPYVITGIILGVFLIIGLMFRAVFLPLRLFFAVVIPIAFVYGCCVGIYQIGWLDGLNISSFKSSDSGLIWMLPVITVTILIGLAMDYEIFLFSRVFEYRLKGYTTEASIILAVSTTGPIISSAGIVMALAFCGLLLQNIVSSNQMGFLFVFGVLIDTFVIRPFLVPSILSLSKKYNWWPTKVPMKSLKNEYGFIHQNQTPMIS